MMRRWRVALAVAATVLAAWVAGCDRGNDEPASSTSDEIRLAPGYGPLGFSAPEPGTYRLPPLEEAADGRILMMDGSPRALHDLLGDKVVLLSLMYASCSDVNGCPLATAVFHQIAGRTEKDPQLAQGLRLLSLSFDPVRDTPEMMRMHAGHHAGHGIDWQFLTTAGRADLQPILDGFGQSLIPEFDENGDEVGEISHILRVYLIDPERRVRNIYSVSYLHADTLVADVKTLLLEAGGDIEASGVSEESRAAATDAAERSARAGPGDSRRGYERSDFETDSRGLTTRRAGSLDLVARAMAPQLGLPPIVVPGDNPLTKAKVELGRRLFYDRRLSLNGTLSCAMCHVPDHGFSHNELATAVGIEGRTVRRNSPTILNVAYADLLFHDGREDRLEQQIWGPLLARNEMGNPSVGAVLGRIRATGDYDEAFERIFPDRGLAIETLGMAIASYERTLVSGGSAFDRWRFGKDLTALGPDEVAGFRLFTGKAGCVACHSIGADSALFMDDQLHNTGIGYQASMSEVADHQAVQLAPGEFVSVASDMIAQVSEPVPGDLGRYEVSQDPADRWKYKTPSLRNVALTAPYMHDGSLSTLREVVEFYDRGGIPNENLDPRIRPLDLVADEVAQLVAFLESLTGSDIKVLADDGYVAQRFRQTRLSVEPNILEISTRSGVMRTGR